MNECKHGMELADCVLCNGRKTPSTQLRSGEFVARYWGTCPECLESIEPGDVLRYIDDGADPVHSWCEQ